MPMMGIQGIMAAAREPVGGDTGKEFLCITVCLDIQGMLVVPIAVHLEEHLLHVSHQSRV